MCANHVAEWFQWCDSAWAAGVPDEQQAAVAFASWFDLIVLVLDGYVKYSREAFDVIDVDSGRKVQCMCEVQLLRDLHAVINVMRRPINGQSITNRIQF